MGFVVPEMIGRNERCYVMRDTVTDLNPVVSSTPTFTRPNTGTANGNCVDPTTTIVRQGQFLPLKTSISSTQNKVYRMDKRSTRSHFERIERMEENTWSLKAYLLPPPTGASSVSRDPDVGAFILGAMGARSFTTDINTQIDYSLSGSQTALGSLSWMREVNSVGAEAVAGAWVEEMKISIAGGEEPRIAFSGGARRYFHTGYSTTATTTGTSVVLATGGGSNFDVGSYITLADADSTSGAATPHLITAISGDTLTITPTLETGLSGTSAVYPYTPTGVSPRGTPINSIDGAIYLDDYGSIGTTVIQVIAAEVTLKNNIKPVNNVAFNRYVPDYIPGIREISGELSLRSTREQHNIFGKRKAGTIQGIRLMFGATTLLRVRINIRCQLDFGELEIPEQDEGVIKVPFSGLANYPTTSGDDEFTLSIL